MNLQIKIIIKERSTSFAMGLDGNSDLIAVIHDCIIAHNNPIPLLLSCSFNKN